MVKVPVLLDTVAADPRSPPWMQYTERQRWRLLAILFLVSTSSYFDRNVISVVLEPIKRQFRVSDTLLGLLGGFCFAIFYSLFGLPVARWADRGNRRSLITLALSTWSVMTLCCGLAQSFWQLALFRIGVGAGEAGAIPPAQSLIADYFPPKRRASALAIFTAAATAGYALGFVAGGILAAAHGWRETFLVGGGAGLALALVTGFGLSEPRLSFGSMVLTGHGERLRDSLVRLKAKRSYLYALALAFAYFLFAFGASLFLPAFQMRVLHVPLEEVSVYFGTVTAIAAMIGTLGGGWLADYLGARDVRWLAWLPAAGSLLTAPVYVVDLSLHDFGAFLAVGFIWTIALTGALPAIFAAIHAVCGSPRRATAVAILLFGATLFGAGTGPLLVGALSDALSAKYAINGLRYALVAIAPLLVVTAGLFFLSGRAMPQDLEE